MTTNRRMFLSLFFLFIIVNYALGHSYDPNGKLLCKYCGNELAYRSKYCPVESPYAQIVGYAHDISTDAVTYRIQDLRDKTADVITFKDVIDNALFEGATDYSVKSSFPPYHYHTLHCSHCKYEIGYSYKAPVPKKPETEQIPQQQPEQVKKPEFIPTKPEEVLALFKKYDTNTKINEEEKILSKYENVCLDYSTGGYWQYKWCFHQEVRQFHLDSTDKPPTFNWSLGKYHQSTNTKDVLYHIQNTGTRSVILNKRAQYYGHPYYVESFVNGQHCDENNRGRETEVRMIFCGKSITKIMSIEEPNQCSYIITICIRELGDIERYTQKVKHCQYCNKPFLVPLNKPDAVYNDHVAVCKQQLKEATTPSTIINHEKREVEKQKYSDVTDYESKSSTTSLIEFFAFRTDSVIMEDSEQYYWNKDPSKYIIP